SAYRFMAVTPNQGFDAWGTLGGKITADLVLGIITGAACVVSAPFLAGTASGCPLPGGAPAGGVVQRGAGVVAAGGISAGVKAGPNFGPIMIVCRGVAGVGTTCSDGSG